MAFKLDSVHFTGQAGFAAGGSGAVCTADLSALPGWAAAPDNLIIEATGKLLGKTSSNQGGALNFAATYKRIAGTLSQPGAAVAGYSFAEADLSPWTGTLTFSGNVIQLTYSGAAVLFTTQLTGYLWLSSTQY